MKKLLQIMIVILTLSMNLIYASAECTEYGETINPVLSSSTTNSITLTLVAGYEYSIDGFIWQDSNVFNELEVNTKYTLYQRFKGNDETCKSSKSEGLDVTTKRNANATIPTVPVIDNKTDTTVTLKLVAGYEYSKDGIIFQDSNIFSGLTSSTTYSFYQRVKETNTTLASAISNKTDCTTLISANHTIPVEVTIKTVAVNSITLNPIEGYEYSKNGITFQDSNIFSDLTVYTKYTFYQRIKATEHMSASATTFVKEVYTLKYDNNNTIDPPQASKIDDYSITLVPVNDTVEYSLNKTTWQDSNTFNNLKANTNYTFYQRIKETNNTNASAISEGTVIKTKQVNTSLPIKPVLVTVNENVVTLKIVEGYEYSVDNKIFQDSNIFTLSGLTNYNFYQRIKNGSVYGSSVSSEPLEVMTKQVVSSIPVGYTAIRNTDDLNNVRNNLSGKYILMNNISFDDTDYVLEGKFFNNGELFAPIGVNDSFTGIFDGNGYYISNLKINSSGKDVGLFSNNKGTIKSLGLINGSITGNSTMSTTNYVGGIAAKNEGTIIDCYNKNTVTSNTTSSSGTLVVGGITGYAYNNSVIKNCYNTGLIISRKYNSGGIVGNSSDNSIIENCYNLAEVNSSSSLSGGIVGGFINVDTNKTKITNCYNEGKIIGTIVGGITGGSQSGSGYNEQVLIKNCYNKGIIEGTNFTAGIIGSNKFLVELCTNYANISLTNSKSRIGGIAAANVGVVKTSTNIGNIVLTYNITMPTTNYDVGGIVGNNIGNVIDCTNKGNITGRGALGGIVGVDTPSETFTGISNCENYGNITGESTLGGIVSLSSATIDNCKNYGTVTGKNYIGGIVGSGGNVTNSSNTGSISGLRQVAGIAGNNSPENTINKCNNFGTVSGNSIISGISSGSANITNSTNTGNISGGSSIAGIASNPSYINNCTNRGNVTSTSNTASGIVSFVSGDKTIENSNNYGTIKSDGNMAGGIVANTILDEGKEPTINNSNNYGDVTVGKMAMAAGIVGGNYGTITNCKNYGTITGSISGGIIGNAATATIKNTENHGNIISNDNTAGGIVGLLEDKAKIDNSDNYGNIFGNTYSGGIVGNTSGTISSCENYGTISSKIWAAGGIVGQARGGSVTNCINKGLVKKSKAYGPIYGDNEDNASKSSNNKNNSLYYLKYASVPNQAYTGSELKPNIKITNGSYTLILNTDYKITYTNNIKSGVATMKIDGINNYGGTVTKTFRIIIGTTITKVDSVRYNSISLSWDKVENASTYQVYRSTNNKTWSLIKTTTGTSYKNTGLKTNANYYYKVRAYRTVSKKREYGPFSNVIKARPKMTTPVVKVSNNLYVYSLVSWNKISGAKGYQVYRCTITNKCTKLKTTTSTSYKDTSAVEGVTYTYKVRAYRTSSGTKYSSFSTLVSGIRLKDPISLKAVCSTYNTIALNITKDANATKYYVYRSTSKTGKYTRIATLNASDYTNIINYTDTKLSFNKTYYYKVKMVFNNASDYSKVVSFKTKLEKTTFTLSESGAKQVSININKVNGATGYIIEKKNSDGKWIKIKTTSLLTFVYDTPNEEYINNKTFTFRVRAYKKVSKKNYYGAYSEITSITLE